MPLILSRNDVLAVYNEAAQKRWVIPTFNTENLTTTEAILSACLDYSRRIQMPDLPITIGITNNYSHRSQSLNYTHTQNWAIGIKLFLADLEVLTSSGSPFEQLNVMIHLDHIQWDTDADLLQWDLDRFSMIMFDASAVPIDRNISLTADFVQRNRDRIVIEGACDEIVDAEGNSRASLTSPELAESYFRMTGVDFIVANLGTEHRASSPDLRYHSELARKIRKRTGNRLVLHGTSSVGTDQIRDLFDDGIAKVNIWTTLERDSAPDLLADMVRHAPEIAGSQQVEKWIEEGWLGPKSGRKAHPSLNYYTTAYRQKLVFEKMKKIVSAYLELWYV